MRSLNLIGRTVASGPSLGLGSGFLRTAVGGLAVAGVLLLSAACTINTDGGGSSDNDPPPADPTPTATSDSGDSTESSDGPDAKTSEAPAGGDASEIETWIADVYLVGHEIGDYTGCLADAVTSAAPDQIPAALQVKSNAELNTAYQTAPGLMDALIAAQNGDCAQFAE
jgi:hypothetical protein